MSARAPMEPPSLPGYRPVRLLGSGGYSDVFLYDQEMPRRQVAIKVLVTQGLGDAGRQQFYDEANAMAAVSTHPYIVTVLDAQVSSGGHPYLVMEFYPGQNFSVRARNEKIPVADVLRTAIQVASAVETAHLAGILHRDIKPANILTSEYNRPGLTDFGIASSVGDGAEAQGMSIPWSPPEILSASGFGNETADVYSLAATIYTLLAGRSPFEIPGGSNRQLDLIQRIDAGSPPPTGRVDVPDSLERLLRHGMSRSWTDRPSSAQHLARMLQSVEIELGLPPTQLEIREDVRDVWVRNDEPDEDGTRLKRPSVIRSQEPVNPGIDLFVTGVPTAHDATVSRTGPDPTGDDTVHRGSTGPGGVTGPGSSTGPGQIVSGVGTRPVGAPAFSGPRPVSPSPAMSEAGMPGFGLPASGTPADGVVSTPSVRRTASPMTTVVKVAWVVLAVVAALVVAKLVVGAGSKDPDPPESSSTTENTLPPGGTDRPPTPTNVTVAAGPGGAVITWEHPDQDPADFSYTILDPVTQGLIATVDGALTVTVTDPPACVRVLATSKDGGPSSVEVTPDNTNC